MTELKTTVNDANVNDYLNTVENEQKKADSFKLLKIFTRITGENPKMWGSSIVGFGQYHYKYERSSQEGDWMLTGFSPRKQSLTLYILCGFDDFSELLDRLGKHKISKSCLYIKKLDDINLEVLEELIRLSCLAMKKEWQSQ